MEFNKFPDYEKIKYERHTSLLSPEMVEVMHQVVTWGIIVFLVMGFCVFVSEGIAFGIGVVGIGGGMAWFILVKVIEGLIIIRQYFIDIKEINLAERERKLYIKEFDKCVADLVVQFPKSEHTKEIINWLTNMLCYFIKNADKRSHIKEIIVELRVYIYADRIECYNEKYDFKQKGCKNLNAAEIKALSIVISRSIESYFAKLDKTNPSDTNDRITYELKYTYYYQQLLAVISFEYRTMNKNYNKTNASNW